MLGDRHRLTGPVDEPDAHVAQEDELARRSGVAIQTVNRLCTNRTARVDLATLDAIAAALGVEPGELIVREPAKRGRRK